MIGILIAFFSVLAAAGFSRRLFTVLRIQADPSESFVFSLGIGIALLSVSTLLLGLAGMLTVQSICVMLAVLAVLSLRGMPLLERDAAELFCAPSRQSFFLLTSLAVSAGVAGAALAGVLAPETANDSLCYHLHIPREFLRIGRIQKLPFEVNSLFPFFMEMFGAIGLAFKSIPMAKAFHLFAGVLCALAVFASARRWVSYEAAAAAALLLFSVPGFVNQYSTTYVDVGLSLFVYLFYWAYSRWADTQRSFWMAICGFMAGAAMSIKYIALIPIFAVSLLFVYDGLKLEKKQWGKSLLIFLAPFLLVSAYWYVRAWMETGNPVYPYFYSVFKSGDPTIHYNDIGVKKTFLNFCLIPWTITMKPQLFEGFGDNIGPVFLCFAPIGLAAMRNTASGKRAAAFAFIYLLCWFVLGQSLRFAFPLLPVLALVSSWGIQFLIQSGARIRGLTWSCILGILILQASLAVYHYRRELPFLTGRIEANDYLFRRERSFSAADFINRNTPPDSKVLSVNEVRLFYFNRPIVREDIYARDTAYFEKFSNPSQVIDKLKSDGFTHIVLAQYSGEDLKHLPELRIQKWLNDPQKSLALSGPPLYTYTFKYLDQPAVTYRIYKL